MSKLFTIVGVIVVLLVLASSGVMRGDVCIGSIGCVGAHGRSVTLHPSR